LQEVVSGANGALPEVEQERVVGVGSLTNDHGVILRTLDMEITPAVKQRTSVSATLNDRFAN
jgi:hypothetical protein